MPRRSVPSLIARRVIGLALGLVLLAAFVPRAGAVTGGEVDAAKTRVEQLRRQIETEKAALSSLAARSGALALRLSEAEGSLQQIEQDLARTRADLAETRATYEEIRTRLNDRAHLTYMNGPGSSLEFLLGASSLADFTDRLEFLNAASQADADLANQAENIRSRLLIQEQQQRALQAKQAKVVAGLRADQAELNAQLAEQKQILGDVAAKEREAEQAASQLSRQYQQQLGASFGGPVGDGPIRVCPVGQPRGFGDDFGAPRYTGGYHPHAGNDIFAPEGTPIYAPFDGAAEVASNGLGGLSVIVRGSDGWVYNAHLSRFGTLGPVSTGDVVGYVGNTGDAIGSSPHDHFEWHPNVIPSNWPPSGYGYSFVGDAINPRPLLLQVC